MEMIIGSDMEMSSFGIGMMPILFSFFGSPEFPAALVFSIQFSLLKADPCRKLLSGFGQEQKSSRIQKCGSLCKMQFLLL